MKVYQIYFDESQLPGLEYESDGWFPFYNSKATVFFENEVIRHLVEFQKQHLDTDYLGVVSYKLRQKLGYMKDKWKSHPNIANHSVESFTPEQFARELYKGKPDAMSFQRHMPHDCVSVAEKFHPGFAKFYKEILNKIGIDYKPQFYQNVFYCNYFVAKSEIYGRYVAEMLSPAMDVMRSMPELEQKCSYPFPIPEETKKQTGFDHWTYHAFLCERFFTHFAHMHNLKCLHY